MGSNLPDRMDHHLRGITDALLASARGAPNASLFQPARLTRDALVHTAREVLAEVARQRRETPPTPRAADGPLDEFSPAGIAASRAAFGAQVAAREAAGLIRNTRLVPERERRAPAARARPALRLVPGTGDEPRAPEPEG